MLVFQDLTESSSGEANFGIKTSYRIVYYAVILCSYTVWDFLKRKVHPNSSCVDQFLCKLFPLLLSSGSRHMSCICWFWPPPACHIPAAWWRRPRSERQYPSHWALSAPLKVSRSMVSPPSSLWNTHKHTVTQQCKENGSSSMVRKLGEYKCSIFSQVAIGHFQAELGKTSTDQSEQYWQDSWRKVFPAGEVKRSMR